MIPTAPKAPGIIPARAGFTQRVSWPYPRLQDHPRSRGVYSDLTNWQTTNPGSSPLARGLQAREYSPQRDYRIIPARAGFTALAISTLTDAFGSSPLARGLRNPIDKRVAELRIIPARAGFTAADAENTSRNSDHPRSRGVYSRAELDQYLKEGSSPLARGLHVEGQAGPVGLGIIPARAGFTGV